MEGLSKSPSVFDYEKLKWFNSEYIKMMAPEAFAEKTVPMLKEICPDYVDAEKLAKLLHTRVSTLNEVKEKVDFVVSRLPMEGDLYTNKKNKTTPELCRQILTEVKPQLEACADWSNDSLFELLKGYAAEAGIKAGAVMWAVRIAVARQAVTPGGATELMEVFGRGETLGRMDQALAELA